MREKADILSGIHVRSCGLVTAQLWAAFSVQLPVFEMQAPIQKIKNGRCRKTPKGLPMAERDKRLGLSGIKDSYHLNDGGSTAS